jgi:AcrR family transcriptional regulator
MAAGEQLFADRGFSAVSVRDIAAAAEVNVAAVNYHFQSKENLYREVLTQVIGIKRDRYVAGLKTIRRESPGDLEAAVAGFFRMHFEDTLKTEAGGSFLKLLVRELHHGRPETSKLIAEMLIPMWDEVGRVMLDDRGIGPDAGAWIVGSLHGQLVHFTMRWLKTHPCGLDDRDADDQFRNMMAAIFPPLAADVDEYIDQAVAHITRFSVAGIQAVLAGSTTPSPEADPS